MKVLVAVITYRRPEALKRTIASVRRAQQAVEAQGHRVRMVVIDNDESASAEPVCRHLADVKYIVESQPGIPAARNAALAERHSSESLAFIDDDEVASEGWLAGLMVELERSAADAVFGPVLPVLPQSAPSWIVRGRFFDRPTHRTGEAPRHPATNNVLMSATMFDKAPMAQFDPAFASSGGSDTAFFLRLKAAGAVFSWAPDATVEEVVPDERATFVWLWRRNIRLGNVTARIRFPHVARWAMATFGCLRITVGVILTSADMVWVGHAHARHATHIPKGLGMVLSSVGQNHDEYKRHAVA